MGQKSNCLLLSYGVHRAFTDAGNVVDCRYCVHNQNGHCVEHDEEVTPGSRCFANFVREVGSDDEAEALPRVR
jgi:hypothetical protein